MSNNALAFCTTDAALAALARHVIRVGTRNTDAPVSANEIYDFVVAIDKARSMLRAQAAKKLAQNKARRKKKP